MQVINTFVQVILYPLFISFLVSGFLTIYLDYQMSRYPRYRFWIFLLGLPSYLFLHSYYGISSPLFALLTWLYIRFLKIKVES